MKVAVIGAGVSGITAIRHLSERYDINHVVVFEKNRDIGGTWIYTDRVGLEEDGLPVHTSMYKDLWTNSPQIVTKFHDFDYRHPRSPGSCVPQEEVLEYLNDYVDHYKIRSFMKFETEVLHVEPINLENKRLEWQVTVRRLAKPQAAPTMEIFDAVFVCNGIYSVPKFPDITGLTDFKGQVIHSHDFRRADAFEGQTVACVGAGLSGIDISMAIEPHAKQVYLSSWSPFFSPTTEFPKGVKLVLTIREVKEHSMVFDDGQEEDVDTIILCTGYKYSFPFLADVCQPKNESGRLTPLYKHMVHVQYPTLFFIGLNKMSLTFPVAAIQAQLAVQIITGNITLPSREVMLEEIDSDYNWRLSLGMSPRRAHHLFPYAKLLSPYLDGLLAMDESNSIESLEEALLIAVDKFAYILLARPVLLKEHMYKL